MPKPKPIYIALAVAAIIILVHTVRWQSQFAKYGCGFDQMTSVSLGTQAYLDIKAGQYQGYDPEGYNEANRRPPMAFFISALVMLIFGPSFATMASTNLLFFFLFLAAIFILAARRWGGPAGVVAISLILLSHAFIKYLLTWNSDMAGVAVVAWALVLIDEPQADVPLWRLALFGLICQVGMQTRLTFPLFIFAPAGYVLFRETIARFKQSKKDWWIAPTRWLIPIAVYRISGQIFARDRSLLKEVTSVEMDEVGSAYHPFHTLQGKLFLLDWWHELGAFLILAGLAGIGWMLLKDRKNFWFPFIWLIVPAAGFAYFAVNATRLALPAFGALAVLASGLIIKVDPKKTVYGAMILLMLSLYSFTHAAKDNEITMPPTFGSGWEPYDAQDLLIAEIIRDKPGPILMVDRFADRIFSTYMLPSQIVFQNPDRPFFKIGYEYELEQISEIYDIMAAYQPKINTVIIRQPQVVKASWHEGGAEDYLNLITSMGRLNLEETFAVMQKIMTTTIGMKSVYEKDYTYGSVEMKITVLQR